MDRTTGTFDPVRTDRLRLRRPTGADLDAAYAIHHDPATNRFNPAGPDPDREASAQRLQEWLEHWTRYGFGYWAVQVEPEPEVVGFAGVRHEQWLGVEVLNLYYRFATSAWGQGYATEAARAAVGLAAERFAGTPVLARTTAANVGSQRTALAAGLTRRPDLDRPVDGIPSVILVTSWPG